MKAKAARVIGVVVAALFILTALIGLLIFIPQWQAAHIANDATRLEREDSTRRTLAQIMGGTVGLVIIYITWQRLQVAREELGVSQEGQVTERFSRAIEHLGNDSLDVRLGAIYALERIARDSRQDHWPVMEILTAYVREHAPWHSPPEDQQPAAADQRPAPPPDPGSGDDDEPPRLATDIQAVLTILGRRQANYDPPGQRLDLRNTDLRRADLSKANLQGALLTWSSLQRATLMEARLQGAELSWANLQPSNLMKAQLQGSYLIGANLQQALLFEATLEEAWLVGADLRKAIGLVSQQLKDAFGDVHTKLPPEIERPSHWTDFSAMMRGDFSSLTRGLERGFPRERE